MKKGMNLIALLLAFMLTFTAMPLQTYSAEYTNEDEWYSNRDEQDEVYEDDDNEVSENTDHSGSSEAGEFYSSDDQDQKEYENAYEYDSANVSNEAENTFGEAVEVQSEVIVAEPQEEFFSIDGIDLPDNDTMLEGYIEQIAEELSGEEVDISFGEEESVSAFEEYENTYREAASYSGPTRGTAGNSGSRSLTPEEQAIYNILQEKISEIADGREHLAKFEIPLSGVFDESIFGKKYTADDLGVESLGTIEGGYFKISEAAEKAIYAKLHNYDLKPIIDTLLRNDAYELYWFDKKKGWGYTYPWTSWSENNIITSIEIVNTISMCFYVSENYKDKMALDDADFTTSDVTEKVNPALEEANRVVANASSETDKRRLEAYKKYICDHVSYNSDAADDNNNTPYGDPWQLIWVFDNDKNTNVVCEGYSKAFKLLCDMTGFVSPRIKCYLVSGLLNKKTGGHMWNVVTMNDGGSYLVDVTNCDDDETEGGKTDLYLAGWDRLTTEKLGTFTDSSFGYGIERISKYTDYKYDDGTDPRRGNMKALYSDDILAIEHHDYGESQSNKQGTSIKDATITLRPEYYYYDGESKEPEATVEIGDGNTLTKGTDYTVSYDTDHTNVGTKMVTITGIGNYDGTRTIGYTINQTSQQSITATIGGKSENVTLAPGSTAQISVTKKYYDATENLAYSSSNNSVVSVDDNGNVGAGTVEGTATITVTLSGTDNCNKATTTLDITVATPQKESIENAEITLEGGDSYTYTGSQITPAILIVTLNGKTLNSGTDYTDISYGNNTNVSEGGTVSITGIGEYTGTASKTFNIEKATPTLKVKADGDEIENGTLSLVKGGSKSLSIDGAPEGSDIEYEFDDSVVSIDNHGVITGVGKGSATITATSQSSDNYNEGTVSFTVTVFLPVITGDMVTLSSSSLEYNGENQSPEVTVRFDENTTLAPEADYGLTFSEDIKNVGEKTVTVTGKGEYDGTVTKNYSITKTDKQTVAATVGNETSISLQLGQTSEVITATRGIADDKASDFTFASNDTTIATVDDDGKIKAAGVGNTQITVTSAATDNSNEASVTIDVTVTGLIRDLSDNDKVEITLTDNNEAVTGYTYTYDGTPHNPVVSVTYDGNPLTQGENGDYIVSITNNTDAGEARVVIIGTEKNGSNIAYIGKNSKTFTIQQKSIEGGTLVLKDGENEVDENTYIYDRSVKEPDTYVTVKLGDNDTETTLGRNTDYTVSYANNINASTDETKASVTVTGTGNYTGSLTKGFSINKQTQSMTVSAESGTVLVGEDTAFTVDGAEGIVNASIAEGGTDIVTVSTSETNDKKATITVQGKKAGDTTITVSSASSNFETVTKTIAITVNDTLEAADVVFGEYDKTYSGR